MINQFTDRREAGMLLAEQLKNYRHQSGVIVLGLPRGGVVVAYEIAKVLHAPLDVSVVRKLGVPHNEEFAMGAIASGGTIVFNDEVIEGFYISEHTIKHTIQAEKEALQRRELLYHGTHPVPILTGKTVIVVDDGIATGASIRAAITAINKQKPAHLIVAVPVAAASTYDEIAGLVEQVVCPLQPSHFDAVGEWYLNFPEITDDEVMDLLTKAREGFV